MLGVGGGEVDYPPLAGWGAAAGARPSVGLPKEEGEGILQLGKGGVNSDGWGGVGGGTEKGEGGGEREVRGERGGKYIGGALEREQHEGCGKGDKVSGGGEG